MTVNLTRIYTKLGDGGETHLGDMSRVSKLHPRVEAYGTVDELNATIGVALLQPGLPSGSRSGCARVQNDLLDLGADLSVPGPAPTERREAVSAGAWAPARRRRVHAVARAGVRRGQRDARAAALVRDPGRHPAAAHLHVCRTVCRRAERRAIAVGAEVNPEVVRYLNRLSDLLFILSRARERQAASRGARAPVGSGRARSGAEPPPAESGSTEAAPPPALRESRRPAAVGGAQRRRRRALPKAATR